MNTTKLYNHVILISMYDNNIAILNQNNSFYVAIFATKLLSIDRDTNVAWKFKIVLKKL